MRRPARWRPGSSCGTRPSNSVPPHREVPPVASRRQEEEVNRNREHHVVIGVAKKHRRPDPEWVQDRLARAAHRAQFLQERPEDAYGRSWLTAAEYEAAAAATDRALAMQSLGPDGGYTETPQMGRQPEPTGPRPPGITGQSSRYDSQAEEALKASEAMSAAHGPWGEGGREPGATPAELATDGPQAQPVGSQAPAPAGGPAHNYLPPAHNYTPNGGQQAHNYTPYGGQQAHNYTPNGGGHKPKGPSHG